MKNSTEAIGNRTRDLRACSATAPPCVPCIWCSIFSIRLYRCRPSHLLPLGRKGLIPGTCMVHGTALLDWRGVLWSALAWIHCNAKTSDTALVRDAHQQSYNFAASLLLGLVLALWAGNVEGRFNEHYFFLVYTSLSWSISRISCCPSWNCTGDANFIGL